MQVKESDVYAEIPYTCMDLANGPDTWVIWQMVNGVPKIIKQGKSRS